MRKVSLIGLGYVGLPLAVAFGEIQNTIGFDVNEKRIDELKRGEDSTGEIYKWELTKSDISFTTDPEDLKTADFHIVTVPTPIDSEKRPDLSLVESASETVGLILKGGDTVAYESTVSPGVTEDICIPILEKFSGLKAGADFKVCYSPERVSPGSAYSLKKIHKLVAGQDEAALEIATKVYREILGDLVVPVSSIKVAEASKVLENVQRDVNIALMNQVSVLFKEMGIDTQEVLNAAGTKWNFGKYYPGLVGGHCIGVDTYYLIHSGDRRGIELSILKESRKANEYMTTYIAEHCERFLISKNKNYCNTTVTIIGQTFKEDCPDTRNSKAMELAEELKELEFDVRTYDPVLTYSPASGIGPLEKSDIVIFAVAHTSIKENLKLYSEALVKSDSMVMDIKGMFSKESFGEGVTYWRL